MSEAWAINPATGRYVCSPEHPMPKGAEGQWEHTNVKDDGECMDSCCDYWICSDCGLRFRTEVAQ